MSLIDQAINIAKDAESRKSEIEELRDIPVDIIEKIKIAGLVKMWATKACYGSETPVSEVSQLIASMAEYNASLAWVVAVTNCSSLITGFVPQEMASLLFGDQLAMVGGFAGPVGRAIKKDGSLVINGNWSWGSGIKHCSHIVGGTFITKDENIIGSAVAFFEPAEIDMIDNWQVMGLKGSHSIDYKTKDCVIPKERWTFFPVNQATSTDPLYQFSFLGALSISVASVAVGLARRALTELQDIASTKRPFGQGKTLARRSNFQEHFGKLQAKLKANQHYFQQSIAEVEEAILLSSDDLLSKADIRLAAAYCTEVSADIVRDCYRLAGGSAIWNYGKLEEIMRDCHVVTQHGMVNQSNYRTGGAVHLGQDVPAVVL